MTSTAPADADLRPLDPRVRTLWWIRAAIVAGLLVMAAAVVAITVGGLLAVIGGIVAVVACVLAGAVPPIRYRRWAYLVRDDDMWTREGVWWVTTTVVPFSRLQFVDTKQGPLERALGLASLELYTAALGARTTIPGLAVAEAEALRERLGQVDPDVVST